MNRRGRNWRNLPVEDYSHWGKAVVEVEEIVEDVVEDVVEEIVEDVVEEDELLHEHGDGTLHSHEGGDEPHEHEEDLDEEVKGGDVSDSSNSGGGTNPWLRGN